MAEIGRGAATYLAAYPGAMVSAVQVWYEGLEGHGAPTPEEKAGVEAAIVTAGWTDAGDVRDERYGLQKSFKRA